MVNQSTLFSGVKTPCQPFDIRNCSNPTRMQSPGKRQPCHQLPLHATGCCHNAMRYVTAGIKYQQCRKPWPCIKDIVLPFLYTKVSGGRTAIFRHFLSRRECNLFTVASISQATCAWKSESHGYVTLRINTHLCHIFHFQSWAARSRVYLVRAWISPSLSRGPKVHLPCKKGTHTQAI